MDEVSAYYREKECNEAKIVERIRERQRLESGLQKGRDLTEEEFDELFPKKEKKEKKKAGLKPLKKRCRRRVVGEETTAWTHRRSRKRTTKEKAVSGT